MKKYVVVLYHKDARTYGMNLPCAVHRCLTLFYLYTEEEVQMIVNKQERPLMYEVVTINQKKPWSYREIPFIYNA